MIALNIKIQYYYPNNMGLSLGVNTINKNNNIVVLIFVLEQKAIKLMDASQIFLLVTILTINIKVNKNHGQWLQEI